MNLYEYENEISSFVIFHRRLGCGDESSTDDEQKERILYYFPQDVSVYAQLSQLSMIEGLIEFTNKFSSEIIEYITMNDCTWAFFQCEPDIWIVTSHKNNTDIKNPNLIFKHRPNGSAMVKNLQYIYSLYCVFHGGMENHLIGASNKGWITINAVQESKKKLRKLNIKLQQEKQDLESASNPENQSSNYNSLDENNYGSVNTTKLDVLRFETLIKNTNNDIDKEKDNLEKFISSKDYTPVSLSENLSLFMNWYILTGELLNPSALHRLHSQKITNDFMNNTGHFQHLLRVRHAAIEASGGLCTGCLLLYDGGIIWNDLDDQLSLYITEFIRLQEYVTTRESYSLLMTLSAAGIDFSPPGSDSPSDKSSSKSSSTSTSNAPVKNFVRRVSSTFGMSKKPEQIQVEEKWQKQEESWGKYMSSRKGFVCEGWQTMDASTLGFPPNISNRSLDTTVSSSGGLDCLKSIISSQCEKGMGIWCPNIYSVNTNSSSHQSQNSLRFAIENKDEDLGEPNITRVGKMLVFRYRKFICVLLIKDWGENDAEPPKQPFFSSVSMNIPPTNNTNNNSNFKPFNANSESNRLATTCLFIQQALVPELELLGTHIDSTHTPPISINNQMVSSVQAPKETSAEFPEGVHLWSYHLDNLSLCTRGIHQLIKIPDISPLGIWPFPLGNRKQQITASMNSKKTAYSVRGSVSSSSPIRLESMDIVERDVSESTMQNVHHNFPLPPALLTGVTDPIIINTLNDLVQTIHSEKGIIEVCVRVGSGHRGGLWAIAKKFGDHQTFVIIEGCNTLNEMQELINKISFIKNCKLISC